MNLALFDLDGTLLQIDSDHAFGDFMVRLGWADGEAFRRAMDLSHGSMMTFIERPISAGLLALALFVLIISVLPAVAGKRNEVFVE